MNEIFLKIAEISATTSIVILLVAILSKIIDKKYIAGWKYWIWLLIAIRLLVPFNPSEELFQKKIEVEVPNVSIYVPGYAEPETVPNIVPEQNSGAQISEIPEDKIITPSGREQEGRKKAPLLDTLASVWICGAAVMFLWNVGTYLAFRKVTLGRSVVAKDETQSILSETKTSLGIEKEIKAVVCKNVSSPMIMGFLNPVLVLPEENYSEEAIRFILRHELTHYKRRDTFYKALMLFANAVHWFNPVVWLMRKLADSDLEVSCDAQVISGANLETRKQYSETILSCVHREKAPCAVFSTHFYGGAKTLKKRFANILSMEKRKKGITAFVLVLIFALVLGGTASCTASKAPTDEQVRELVLKADSVYQPGDNSVLETVSYENYINELYYDEIGNFEETVFGIFSKKGIEQILNSREKVSLKPAFFEEEGRYYRYSSMADSDATNYYYSVEYINIVEEEENSFRYAIGHYSKAKGEETATEFSESYVTIVLEDGKYLIEDFDSKRFAAEDSAGEPEKTGEPEVISPQQRAEEIYNSDLHDIYVGLIKECLESIKNGTYESNSLEPSDYPEDFPPVEKIPEVYPGLITLAWMNEEDPYFSSVQYVLEIDENHAIVFEPMMFMSKPGDTEGEPGIRPAFVDAEVYGYENIYEWFKERYGGYFGAKLWLYDPEPIAAHIAALNQLSYENYGAICEERYGTFLFKEYPEDISVVPDAITYELVVYDGVTNMYNGYYLDPYERNAQEVLNYSSGDEMYEYMEQYIWGEFLHRGYNGLFVMFDGKLYKYVGNHGNIGITYGNTEIISETADRMIVSAEVYVAYSGEKYGTAEITFEKFGEDWKITGVTDNF